MDCCPQCGSKKSWHYDDGVYADSVWDRFDKVEPATGRCWKCGFNYAEHINHPLEEQIEKFRKERALRKKGRKEL